MKTKTDEYFEKAKEYYKNSKHILKDIEIKYGYYQNTKKVSKAAGLCWLGVVEAIRGFLIKKGINNVEQFTWDGLKLNLIKFFHPNGVFRKHLEDVYNIVHIFTYYRGLTKVDVVKSGFQSAKYIIEKLTGSSL